jgi:hypothetical protein
MRKGGFGRLFDSVRARSSFASFLLSFLALTSTGMKERRKSWRRL